MRKKRKVKKNILDGLVLSVTYRSKSLLRVTKRDVLFVAMVGLGLVGAYLTR